LIAGVVMERVISVGCIVATFTVERKRLITAGRIETADGVGKKRFGSTGRVLMAGRVVIEA
jgi:hypothetical protein